MWKYKVWHVLHWPVSGSAVCMCVPFSKLTKANERTSMAKWYHPQHWNDSRRWLTQHREIKTRANVLGSFRSVRFLLKVIWPLNDSSLIGGAKYVRKQNGKQSVYHVLPLSYLDLRKHLTRRHSKMGRRQYSWDPSADIQLRPKGLNPQYQSAFAALHLRTSI